MKTFPGGWLVVLTASAALSTSCEAQEMPQPPPPVSWALKQRLRHELLKIANSSDLNAKFCRPNLAIPLAKLGDWEDAQKLLGGASNETALRDQLWKWRAYNASAAGNWKIVPQFAAHIKHVKTRSDCLFFAAREAIDHGTRLKPQDKGSSELKAILTAATSRLQKDWEFHQWAYAGYLWARAGDESRANALLDTALQSAKEKDSIAVKKSEKEYAKFHQENPFQHQNFDSVIHIEGAAGLFSKAVAQINALPQNEGANTEEFYELLSLAKCEADYEALTPLINQLPAGMKIFILYQLANAAGQRGDLVEGRAWYDEAHSEEEAYWRNDTSAPKADEKLQFAIQFAVQALGAARTLNDPTLEAQTSQHVHETIAQLPLSTNKPWREDATLLVEFTEISPPSDQGSEMPKVSASRLDEISKDLWSSAPSDFQFRALTRLAESCFANGQKPKIPLIAQAMLKTALAISPEEQAFFERQPDTMNPYWARTPRVLIAVKWFFIGGDTVSARQEGLKFANSVAPKNKRFVALELLKIGLKDISQRIFDPKIQIQKRQNPKLWQGMSFLDRNFDCGAFAEAEAIYDKPEAPLQWYPTIKDFDRRFQVLTAWITALYPDPLPKAPYVTVNPFGYRATF